MVEVVAERGFAGASVASVIARAGVSRRTFYKQFDSLQDCFEAVIDLSVERAGGLIAEVLAREKCWQDGALDALAALLVFFDSEPQLTRIWFVETVAAGAWALRRREHVTALLRSMIVAYWDAVGDERIDPCAAIGVMASVIGLIQAHLLNEEPEPLIELLGPLMGLTTALYLDKREVDREVERGARLARAIRAGEHRSPPAPAVAAGSADQAAWPGWGRGTVALPALLANPSAHRLRACLCFLAEHPGSSNREIALGIGMTHASQISRLLSALAAHDLASKHSHGAGKPNAWQLTPHGEHASRTLRTQHLYREKV